MKKNERIPCALNYGLREDEILKEIAIMAEDNILPNNKNEMFRRGLHACRYLAEVNDEFLLILLSQTLHKLSKFYLPTALKLSKDLALTIYATKISKHGAESAETFGTVVNTIQTFEEITKKDINSDQEVLLCQEIGKLAISIDTIFLGPKIKKDSEISKYLEIIFTLLASELDGVGTFSDKTSKQTTGLKKSAIYKTKSQKGRPRVKITKGKTVEINP